MSARVENLSWDPIDTVLLDLDGTLLDLAFDSSFWLERVPREFAAARGLSLAQAHIELRPRFHACEGTLNWYCIDYWSRELGLDIESLTRTEAHRVAWLPGAQEFLQGLRARRKRIVLLTNAHPRVLQLKDEQSGVSRYLDAAVSSHECGFPKETPQFWAAVQKLQPFDRSRTLFVDDSPAVLNAARQAGIRWVYAVRRPDSSRPPREHPGVPAVDFVSDLDPGLLWKDVHRGDLGGGLVRDALRSAADEGDTRVLPEAMR